MFVNMADSNPWLILSVSTLIIIYIKNINMKIIYLENGKINYVSPLTSLWYKRPSAKFKLNISLTLYLNIDNNGYILSL